MVVYLNVVQIIISCALILVVLIQARGEGFSGTFSSDSSIFRTRRGVEKLLFNFTIVLAVLFLIISMISVVVARSAGV